MRALPSDLHAERMVLAAALADPSVLDRIPNGHFTLHRNLVICRAIKALAERGDAVDATAVFEEVRRNNEYQPEMLTELHDMSIESAVAVKQAPKYARQLGRAIALRKVTIDAHNLSEEAALDGADPDALLARADAIADDLSRVGKSSPALIKISSDIAAIGEAAYIGLPGRFVRLVEPYTEADPSWLLVLFLVYSGQIIGRSYYFAAGADKHYTNLFACAVGPTAGGRKGSATSAVELFFRHRQYQPSFGAHITGVSSGEGVIWKIRDDVRQMIPNKAGTEWTEEVTEKGVDDKRLLINLSEMRQMFDQARREGNVLTVILRQAWDGSTLDSPTKNSAVKASRPHISVSANVTNSELLRKMDESDAASGLLNRFLWCRSKSSKDLPEADGLLRLKHGTDWQQLDHDFYRLCPDALAPECEVRMDDEAQDMWGRNGVRDGAGLYADLKKGRPGIWGDVTARRAQHVLRMALVFAVFDDTPRLPGQPNAPMIRRRHLEAAMEIWRYCDASAFEVFGESVGDPVADVILDALRESPAGLTQSEISKGPLQRNVPSARLKSALKLLEQCGLASHFRRKSKTNYADVWVAVQPE